MDESPHGVPAVSSDRRRVDRARLSLLERAPTATLHELLVATLDLAEEITGSQIGFFHFVEDDQVTLQLQAWSTSTVARWCTAEGTGAHYPLDRAGVWADCVRSGRPVVHNDYAALTTRRGLPPGHATVHRELSVPVSRAGRICAVVGLGNKATDYHQGDVADLSALADLAWDIAARKRAEEALKASELALRLQQERMDLATSSGKMGLWDLDLVANVAWRTLQHDRLFGYDELQAKWGPEEALRHVVPEDRPVFERAFAEALAGGRFHYLLRIDPANHPRRWLEADGQVFRDQAGRPARMMGTVMDVTERVALRERLEVASRLAALGTLVAGVAHEINNPLVVELANQSVALESLEGLRLRLQAVASRAVQAELPGLDEIVAALQDAQAGGERIARIVKDLMVFRQPLTNRTLLRPADVAEQAVRSLPPPLRGRVTIRVEDRGAPEIPATPEQLKQVLVNLIVNAAKATPTAKPGVIVIRLGPGAPGTALIEVIDRGAGMDARTLDRIFEPFFTTRDVGEGMGLGLAVSHAIVEAHGGTLTATSVPGEGSTFSVQLPVA